VNSWLERWSIKINEEKTQAVQFFRRLTDPEDVLQLNGRDIPSVNNKTYLGATFNTRTTRRHHIERTMGKSFCKYIRTYCLSNNGSLSRNIKRTSYRVLIKSVMNYACPSWEYVADAHLLHLQSLQSRVLHSLESLDKCTPDCELHVPFKIP
jgi:hypothetical protein